jgi:hypothetical protein
MGPSVPKVLGISLRSIFLPFFDKKNLARMPYEVFFIEKISNYTL